MLWSARLSSSLAPSVKSSVTCTVYLVEFLYEASGLVDMFFDGVDVECLYPVRSRGDDVLVFSGKF